MPCLPTVEKKGELLPVSMQAFLYIIYFVRRHFLKSFLGMEFFNSSLSLVAMLFKSNSNYPHRASQLNIFQKHFSIEIVAFKSNPCSGCVFLPKDKQLGKSLNHP